MVVCKGNKKMSRPKAAHAAWRSHGHAHFGDLIRIRTRTTLRVHVVFEGGFPSCSPTGPATSSRRSTLIGLGSPYSLGSGFSNPAGFRDPRATFLEKPRASNEKTPLRGPSILFLAFLPYTIENSPAFLEVIIEIMLCIPYGCIRRS